MAAEPSVSQHSIRRHRFRRATATDAAAVAALVSSPDDLHQVSPLETFPLESATVLHWLLQRNAGHVLEDRDGIVAYGELVPDDSRRDRVWIGHMIVHPRRRGLGLGQRLVQELLRVAEHERQAREVAISAFEDNTRALRCYEGCGFHRVDREKVNGRPLVGMRLRFRSRASSPDRITLLMTGLVAATIGAALFVRSPVLSLAPAIMLLGAVLGPGFVRERRDPWTIRLRVALIPVSIGSALSMLVGGGIALATGGIQQLAVVALTSGSATLIWIALLAAALMRQQD